MALKDRMRAAPRWLATLAGLILCACATVGGQEAARDPAPVVEASAPSMSAEPAAIEDQVTDAAFAASPIAEDDSGVVTSPAEPPPAARTSPEPADPQPGEAETPLAKGPPTESVPAPAPAPEPVPERPAESVLTDDPEPDQSPEADLPPQQPAPPETTGPESATQAQSVKETAPPEMDLDGLERRLRQTKAIGLFTKLELKSQVNDLLNDVENYHRKRSSMTLAQLEEHFNLLVMKLLVLLENEDPQLHREIAHARPALWSTLADPNEFTAMKGT